MPDTIYSNLSEAVVEKSEAARHSFRACSGLMLELGIMSTSREAGFTVMFERASAMREDRGRVFLAEYLARFAKGASKTARKELVLCLKDIGVSNPEEVLEGEKPLPEAL